MVDQALACQLCEANAETRCMRCGLRLCDMHTPRYDRRCLHCEAEYQKQRPRWYRRYAHAVPGAALGLIPGFVVGLAGLTVGLGDGIALFFVCLGAGAVYGGRTSKRFIESVRRQHFLKPPELATARLLPPREPLSEAAGEKSRVED